MLRPLNYVAAVDIRAVSGPAEQLDAASLLVNHMMYDGIRDAPTGCTPKHEPSFFSRGDMKPSSNTLGDVAAQLDFVVATLDELQFGAFDRVSGGLVAVAGLAHQRELLRGGTGQVVDVATHYEFRRKGIGRGVMNALEGHSRQLGLRELEIFGATLKGSLLYEAMGYQYDHERACYTKLLHVSPRTTHIS